jgi:uncharacterized protein YciW
MFASLTEAEAIVLAATVGAVPGILAAYFSYKGRKELRPNGGSSAVDKLHAKLDTHIEQTDTRLKAIEEYITTPDERLP